MEALAFLDLLGFSQMVSVNSGYAKQILHDFYNISFRIIKREPRVQGNLFSDSLLAYSADPALLVNIVTEIYRECLSKNGSYEFDLSKFFLLPRGGVSFGRIDIQDRQEAPNLTKNFIISPALVHSAKMESQIKGSRLLVADFENNGEQVFNWNGNVKSILYEDSTFTFWKNFKYFDALWFLDLSKGNDDQKNEVSSLIDNAIELTKANSHNKNILEQHLYTLRIGLLSYTKFLTPNINPMLSRVINEFQDDKYWLIWLTVFEMIMQSPDNWAFSAMPEVINFYKNISLKKSWSNVIKEINKPKNEYLKNLLNNYVQELSIAHV